MKTLIGCARCSTDKQDLAAQKDALLKLGVAADRVYTDHGFSSTNRARPGLDQALAAVCSGDTLVVSKLDRLARSVPDARMIGDDLSARGVKLQIGVSVHDPSDPMGKLFSTSSLPLPNLKRTSSKCERAMGWHSSVPRETARQEAENLRPSTKGAAPHT